MPSPRKPLTYAQAGVSIDEGDAFAERLSKINPAIGGFSGLFPLELTGVKRPVLVASTDGVGTKILLARQLNRLDTIGIDLVAMVVNDLLTCGARPLFFLDYYAMSKLVGAEADAIIRGIVEGCRQAGWPLIGGETAEMPGLYKEGDFDLAGFGVGLADAEALVDGSRAREGDVALGLASSGVHSNGYSLVRAIVGEAKLDLEAVYEGLGTATLGEMLLRPTRIYAAAVKALQADGVDLRAMAHITGGGLPGNVPRVLPEGLNVQWQPWERPPLFRFLQEQGNVPEDEMLRVFNCGVGYVIVVPPNDADEAEEALREVGETVVARGTVQRA